MVKIKAGVYRLNDVLTSPEYYIVALIDFRYASTKCAGFSVFGGDEVLVMYADGTENGTTVYDDGWVSTNYQIITVLKDTEVDDDMSATWFSENTVPLEIPEDASTISCAGEIIAVLEAEQTATLPCTGKMMESDIVVKIGSSYGRGDSTECIGKHIIEVDALPTENIDEAVLYKMGDSYYKYSEEFKDMLIAYGGDTASYIEMIEAEGMSIELYYVKTRPTDNIEISFEDNLHLYYVEDEDDVLGYGDFEGSGINTWMSLSDEMPYGGAITDVSQITTTDYTLYALVDNGWKRYLVPNGDIAIVANGTFDVTEKAEVTVNVPNVIPNGYIKPSGNLEITENGDYNVATMASVTVNIENESVGGATPNASLTHTAGKLMVILSAIINSGTPTASITREE